MLIRHGPQHYVQKVSKSEKTIASHAAKILKQRLLYTTFLTNSLSVIIPIVIPPIPKVVSCHINIRQKINKTVAVTIKFILKNEHFLRTCVCQGRVRNVCFFQIFYVSPVTLLLNLFVQFIHASLLPLATLHPFLLPHLVDTKTLMDIGWIYIYG